jgi:hypothetical protein
VRVTHLCPTAVTTNDLAIGDANRPFGRVQSDEPRRRLGRGWTPSDATGTQPCSPPDVMVSRRKDMTCVPAVRPEFLRDTRLAPHRAHWARGEDYGVTCARNRRVAEDVGTLPHSTVEDWRIQPHAAGEDARDPAPPRGKRPTAWPRRAHQPAGRGARGRYRYLGVRPHSADAARYDLSLGLGGETDHGGSRHDSCRGL